MNPDTIYHTGNGPGHSGAKTRNGRKKAKYRQGQCIKRYKRRGKNNVRGSKRKRKKKKEVPW